MENSELIHRFIDEGLDPITEQQLFESMAKNPSLRTEFKQYLAFERAAMTDYAAFQPSLSSTNTIFSTLGINPTPVGKTATTQTTFWSKYSGLILTNIASIVITAALIYFFNLQNIDKTTLPKSATNQKSQNTEQNSIPIVSNLDIDSKTKSTNNTPSKIKYIYVDKQEENTTNNPVNQNPSLEQNLSTTSEMNSINSANVAKTIIDHSSLKNRNILDESNLLKINNIDLSQMDFAIKSIDLENLSIMFASNDSYSLPKSQLPRSSQPLFDSKSLVLLYNLSPRFSLGLDLRQEFYYLDYTGQVGAKEFRYEQNTNYTSLGVIGKFNWLNHPNFKSFANLYLGGNQIGQIGRLMIGTEISPSQEYGFIVGLEGTLLRHFHQNKEFWAKKIGLNYGIIFHF